MGRLAHLAPLAAVASALLLLPGCTTAPTRVGSTLADVWRASPNFGARRPNFIILHYTSDDSVAEGLKTLVDPDAGVSAHYLVGRDGRIYQLVDERDRAWHAGVSSWGWDTDLNSASIGIELDNDGTEPYDEGQIRALISLLRDLCARYRIPGRNVLGHSDVAPTRKVDPGRRFPWRQLAQAGFGLWCDPPYPAAPAAFDRLAALSALGYSTEDPAAALRAFRLHFEPDAIEAGQTQDEPDRLQCLLRQARASGGGAATRTGGTGGASAAGAVMGD